MPEPHTHLYEVAVTLAGAPLRTTCRRPAWTPGSYLIREYCRPAQNTWAVDGDGAQLAVEHSDKATWTVVEAGGGGTVTLTDRGYAHDLTVQTSDLTETHGATTRRGATNHPLNAWEPSTAVKAGDYPGCFTALRLQPADPQR